MLPSLPTYNEPTGVVRILVLVCSPGFADSTRRSSKSNKPPRWSTDDISLLKELMALLPDDEKIYKRNVQTLLGEEKFAGLRHRCALCFTGYRYTYTH